LGILLKNQPDPITTIFLAMAAKWKQNELFIDSGRQNPIASLDFISL